MFLAALRRQESEAHTHSIAFVSATAGIVTALSGAASEKGMGGAEMQVCRHGMSLRDRGWDVTFIVSDAAGQPEDIRANGFRFLTGYHARYAAQNRRRLLMRIPGVRFWLVNVPKLWRTMKEADADIYFVRGRSQLLSVVLWFCRMNHKKLVFSLASNRDVSKKRVPERPAGSLMRHDVGIRHADLVFAQHSEQQTALMSSFGKTSELLPNVPPFAAQEPTSSRANRVLWIGSIRPLKRPMLALDVAETLPKVDFCFVYWTALGGGVDIIDEFEARARALPNVELVGYVPHDQLSALLGTARALLHTTAAGVEGFPNVFLEAWSQGVPTVSCFDPASITERERIGRVAHDAESLTAELRALLEDETEWMATARRAVAYVRAHHDPEKIGDQLDRELRALIAGPGCTAG